MWTADDFDQFTTKGRKGLAENAEVRRLQILRSEEEKTKSFDL